MLLAELATTSRAVAETTARRAKIDLLAGCLGAAGPGAVATVVAYLSGELPQRQIGVGWAALRDAPPPAGAASLTVAEVDAAFDRIAAVSGRGSVAARRELVAGLLGRATRAEQDFLIRLLSGELRQGALDGVMADAVAKAAGVPAAEVRRAIMLRGALPPVAAAALAEGTTALRAFGLEVGRPIKPMLAAAAPTLDAALAKLSPTHQKDAPAHDEAPLPSNEDGLPSRKDGPQPGEDAPPPGEDFLRSEGGGLPSREGGPQSRESVPPPDEDVLPSGKGGPQPGEDAPPPSEGVLPTGEGGLQPGGDGAVRSEGGAGRAAVAVEWKLDGIRAQIHVDGDLIRVFTRTLDEITDRLPEVVAALRVLPVRAAVLDGELIALRPDGRPRPFQETAARTATRTGGTAELSVFLFDALHLDGADLLDRPGAERWAALARIAPEPLLIPRVVTGSPAEAAEFFAEAVRLGHEGVLVKSLDTPYTAGRRGAGWIKVKPRHTLDLVVLAAEWGNGRRRGYLSNLHLGARDPATGGFVMLGKTFKGLTDRLLAWQTERFRELAVREGDRTVHLRPEQVVEIAFDGVQRSSRYPGGLALRFARVLRYRDDKTAAEADTIDTVRTLAAFDT